VTNPASSRANGGVAGAGGTYNEKSAPSAHLSPNIGTFLAISLRVIQVPLTNKLFHLTIFRINFHSLAYKFGFYRLAGKSANAMLIHLKLADNV
jgi:hypothetical protein